MKEKTTRRSYMGIKIGVLSAALTVLFAVPLATSAFAAEPDGAAEPATLAAQETQMLQDETSNHILEWGVFGIAAGEFAGLLGMGLRQVQRDKRRRKEEEKTAIRPAPVAVELSYREYKLAREQKHGAVA